MAQRHIEFSIDGLHQSSGCIDVDGRCYGGPIFVGDVFDTAYKISFRQSPEGYDPKLERFNMRKIELRVSSIWAYGKSISELSPGMTARLSLIGISTESLEIGDVIGGTVAPTS